jgi:hypothetical protein
MGRYANDSGGSGFPQAPVGTHVARCIKIIDIGTQEGEYQGKKTKRNQIIVSWELPTELVEYEGEQVPVTVNRFYTNSLGEKANLRHDLESWRGRALTPEEISRFDLENIVGKPCLLTIVGGENNKTKVSNVSGLPKGMTCPPQFNESFTFWLDDFDQEKFAGLREGLQKMIKASEEFQHMQNGKADPDHTKDDDDDDDIPF